MGSSKPKRLIPILFMAVLWCAVSVCDFDCSESYAADATITVPGSSDAGGTSHLSTIIITATAGTGGSIYPSGSVMVTYGGNQSFTITPDPGYSISHVTMDGLIVGDVSTYTFRNITASHTISATFIQQRQNTLPVSSTRDGSGTVTATSPPAGISGAEDYVLGKEDIVKITVYGHPDLTTVTQVSGDGLINLPLIGVVQVSGLTSSQVSQKVREILADGYIVDPKVSVFIEEYRSKKAIIMGQVSKPGVYSLSGNTTLLELLSKAGGLTQESGDKAIVRRKAAAVAPGKQENIITIDLKRLLEEGDTTSDIVLMDGDSVYVARSEVFYITGEVKKPDAFKFEEGMTVIKAVTMAGGFTDKAAPGRVKIIRKIQGKEKIIEKAEMEEPVRSDDIIVVPESFF
jgi:polysaccharide biosynthesis/export protein